MKYSRALELAALAAVYLLNLNPLFGLSDFDPGEVETAEGLMFKMTRETKRTLHFRPTCDAHLALVILHWRLDDWGPWQLRSLRRSDKPRLEKILTVLPDM